MLFLVVGLLLILVALTGSVLRRLPVSMAMVYLAVGFGLSPAGAGLVALDPVRDAPLLERAAEVAVIVSLFTAGLKLRVPVTDRLWRPPLRLAFGAMTLTVGLVALIGVLGLGLPPGPAILLGAVLAPTDPVLASDVEVTDPTDRDRLRFALTGEAGLNDGAAFPFVMLGLGLTGLHELGRFGWRWLAVDLVWGVAGGLALGALLGTAIGRLVVHLRRAYKTAVGLDEFLTLGLIASAYGSALLAHTYGFLAVFAAGLALRRIERQAAGDARPDAIEELAEVTGGAEAIATHPDKAPAYMTRALLGFNEQLERIGELGIVLMVGAMLARPLPAPEALWFVPLLFLVVRPLAVVIGLEGAPALRRERLLAAWFGIRGIGSIYYLAYAVGQGLPPEVARQLAALTLATVAASVVVHGVSVTPLMAWHERRRARR
ncbi:MAG TPA: cation:proton antiporter [Thermodesulfobacteriota bacterium]|nr:cation:proton antiporter [Thermodesulfobacteriota bacterium]